MFRTNMFEFIYIYDFFFCEYGDTGEYGVTSLVSPYNMRSNMFATSPKLTYAPHASRIVQLSYSPHFERGGSGNGVA